MRNFSNHATNRHPDRELEITDIQTSVVEGNFEWNLVRVETDAGITGVGESYRGGGVTELMEYTERFLIGENPLDVERLFRRIIQEMSGHGGTTGKVVTAASGIEIALWDIAGKATGLPVYQLLGGKYRDEVRLYVDCHAGEPYEVEHGYGHGHDAEAYTPDAYAETAKEAVDEGFTALKFDLDYPFDNVPDPYNGRVSNASMNHKRDIVAAVRDAVGYEIDLAFDAHWDYSLDSAKRLCRILEPFDLMWLEDVLPPENAAAQREVTRNSRVPIATGENRFRVHEFQELLYEFGVDIVTPDPTTVGGLAESKAIANRAEENYIVFSPHNVCSPIGTMACVHLGASIPNFGVLEYHARDVPWWAEMLDRDRPLIEEGYIEVPETPGLGIELDEAVIEDHLLAGGTLFD